MPDDERRATENLLAGFDRTGRTPRAPPVRAADVGRAQSTVYLGPPRRPLWPWVAIGIVLATSTIAAIALLAAGPRAPLPAPAPLARPAPTVIVVTPVTTASTASTTPATPTTPPAPNTTAPTTTPAAPAVPAVKPSASGVHDDARVDFVRSL